MVEKTLDRRWMLRGAGAAGAAMVGGIALAGAAPANERGSTDMRRNSVEGSWLIEHQDDPAADNPAVRAVASFAAGGVYTGIDIAPPSPAQAGSWESTGAGAFRATFWTGDAGPAGSGAPAVVVRVRPRGRVNGDRISGTYRVQVWDAATGTVLQSGTGRFWGTRIEA